MKNSRRRKKRVNLKEIMNCGMFKLFQGHVIAHSNVLVIDHLLKLLLGKIFVLKKSHRNASKRLRRSSFSCFG